MLDLEAPAVAEALMPSRSQLAQFRGLSYRGRTLVELLPAVPIFCTQSAWCRPVSVAPCSRPTWAARRARADRRSSRIAQNRAINVDLAEQYTGHALAALREVVRAERPADLSVEAFKAFA
ncbi:hypothetical protein [Pseudonocardia humida]|uniref:Uncharacterized protein n=1 Tax=Pseudonocardia humida TaxID=2800819 RepID=A0ABT1AD52_9PSEU|nr:hypothetical protein [Pseudonocardia humida]MCO1660991.1 hypothetical protein [Pseudonocardia humida]